MKNQTSFQKRWLLCMGMLGVGVFATSVAVTGALAQSLPSLPVPSLPVLPIPALPLLSNKVFKVSVTNDSPWFVPMRISGTIGDSVEWTNLSQGTHTLTSLMQAVPQLTSIDTSMRGAGVDIGGAFDRRAFLPTAKFRVTFNNPGTFPYICFIHPYMAGNVTINLPGLPIQKGPVPDVIQGTNTPFGGLPNNNGFGPGVGEVCITADFEKPSAALPSGVVHCMDARSFTDLPLATFDALPSASLRSLTFPGDTTTVGLNGRKIGARFDGIDNAHNIWFDKTGQKMFVTEWHGSHFWTINRMTNTVTSVTTVFTGADVTHVMTTLPAENTGVLTLEGGVNGHLGFFDPATSAMTQLFSFGPQHHPHGPWIVCPGGGNGGGVMISPFPMSNHIGFTNLPATPGGVVSDRASGAQLSPGVYPVAVGATASLCQGAKSYTSNAVSGNITVSDVMTGGVVTTIDLGICLNCTILGLPAPHTQVPIQIPVSPDNKYVMVNMGKASQVGIISVASDTVIGHVDCGSGCHGSNFGLKKGGGFYHWATMQYQNKVTVTDMDSLSKAGDVPLNVRSILTLQGLTPLGMPTALGVAEGQSGGMGTAAFPLPGPWHTGINVIN